MKITYRPEIDGLRAIVVFAVIFYHANLTLFGNKFLEGGFIGVDVFFVISGYLITTFILKELETTGRFSFLNFYERRARRILPALFTIMLTFSLFAWMFLMPTAYVDFAKSLLSSISFGSNFYFHYTGLAYAAPLAEHTPLLHTWSLSIEEQFLLLSFIMQKSYCLTIIFLKVDILVLMFFL